MASTYQIEPHAPWLSWCVDKDIIVADSDTDALRQARARVAAGAVYRYASASGIYNYLGGRITLVYVANFFRWEHR